LGHPVESTDMFRIMRRWGVSKSCKTGLGVLRPWAVKRSGLGFGGHRV